MSQGKGDHYQTNSKYLMEGELVLSLLTSKRFLVRRRTELYRISSHPCILTYYGGHIHQMSTESNQNQVSDTCPQTVWERNVGP